MLFHNSGRVAPAPPKGKGGGEEQIRAQLERVLNSPLFRSSQRCQALLRHVAEAALAGHPANLKERSLGIDVFGRMPDYDTNTDPVVRGTAGEVRKKLAQYYQDPAHSAELRIDLVRGSYVPEFHTARVELHASNGLLKPRMAAAAIGALMALTALLALVYGHWRNSDLDRFWRPMLNAPGDVLFCLPQPRVYSFRSDARQKEIETQIQGMSPPNFEASRELIPLSQLIPLWDRYLAVGDTACLLRLASVLEKHGKPYAVRSEAVTNFSDLRKRPSILIGAFDNDWTLRAVGEMRFTFYKDFQGLEMVRDRDHPDNTRWKLLNSWPQWNIPEDYAIVARVFDVHTDGIVTVAAGITHFGTAGSGEFLSNPQYFSEVVAQLPRDWPRRNLQIVLRIPVVQGTSGHPQVVATHVW
jgi:hypothetical protein